MLRNCLVLTAVFVVVLFIAGCGSDGSKDAKNLIKSQTDVTENYVNGLINAKNADEVVAAIEDYTKGMKDLIPKLDVFYKSHPDYTQGEMPKDMAADLKRMEEASGKIPAAMMKITSHMMDPKVQQAMMEMGNEMGKLNQ